MSTLSLPHKAENLIPHSGIMCVVDDLILMKDGVSKTTTTINKNSPFLRQDGTVEESIFVEMIAQTIAAGSGFDLTEEERETQEGYLLGIRNLKIFGKARLGDLLLVQASKTAEYEGIGIVEGSVFRGSDILATGEIKVIQILNPANPSSDKPANS